MHFWEQIVWKQDYKISNMAKPHSQFASDVSLAKETMEQLRAAQEQYGHVTHLLKLIHHIVGQG